MEEVTATQLLNKIRLEPGMVWVVRGAPRDARTKEFIGRLRDFGAKAFVETFGVIFLDEGVSLEALSEEAMNCLGWYRRPGGSKESE